jgi:hypothetical protein
MRRSRGVVPVSKSGRLKARHAQCVEKRLRFPQIAPVEPLRKPEPSVRALAGPFPWSRQKACEAHRGAKLSGLGLLLRRRAIALPQSGAEARPNLLPPHRQTPHQPIVPSVAGSLNRSAVTKKTSECVGRFILAAAAERRSYGSQSHRHRWNICRRSTNDR